MAGNVVAAPWADLPKGEHGLCRFLGTKEAGIKSLVTALRSVLDAEGKGDGDRGSDLEYGLELCTEGKPNHYKLEGTHERAGIKGYLVAYRGGEDGDDAVDARPVLCRLPLVVEVGVCDSEHFNRAWQFFTSLCVFPFPTANGSEGLAETANGVQATPGGAPGPTPKILGLVTDVKRAKDTKRLERLAQSIREARLHEHHGVSLLVLSVEDLRLSPNGRKPKGATLQLRPQLSVMAPQLGQCIETLRRPPAIERSRWADLVLRADVHRALLGRDTSVLTVDARGQYVARIDLRPVEANFGVTFDCDKVQEVVFNFEKGADDGPKKGRGALRLSGGQAALQAGVNRISRIISGVRSALEAAYGPSLSSKAPVGPVPAKQLDELGYLASSGDILALVHKVSGAYFNIGSNTRGQKMNNMNNIEQYWRQATLNNYHTVRKQLLQDGRVFPCMWTRLQSKGFCPVYDAVELLEAILGVLRADTTTPPGEIKGHIKRAEKELGLMRRRASKRPALATDSGRPALHIKATTLPRHPPSIHRNQGKAGTPQRKKKKRDEESDEDEEEENSADDEENHGEGDAAGDSEASGEEDGAKSVVESDAGGDEGRGAASGEERSASGSENGDAVEEEEEGDEEVKGSGSENGDQVEEEEEEEGGSGSENGDQVEDEEEEEEGSGDGDGDKMEEEEEEEGSGSENGDDAMEEEEEEKGGSGSENGDDAMEEEEEEKGGSGSENGDAMEEEEEGSGDNDGDSEQDQAAGSADGESDGEGAAGSGQDEDDEDQEEGSDDGGGRGSDTDASPIKRSASEDEEEEEDESEGQPAKGRSGTGNGETSSSSSVSLRLSPQRPNKRVRWEPSTADHNKDAQEKPSADRDAEATARTRWASRRLRGRGSAKPASVRRKGF